MPANTPTIYAAPAWARALTDDVIAARCSVDAYLFGAVWAPKAPSRGKPDPHRALVDALRAAAARGVRVTITLQAPAHRLPTTTRAATTTARMAADNVIARLSTTGGVLHAKAWIIDSATLWIGSANLTPRACRANRELMIRLPLASADLRIPNLLNLPAPQHGKSN